MKDASQFPVTFGYGATDDTYYGPKAQGKATYIGPYHRGDDRAMRVGTPVVVNGVIIGKSGNGDGRYGAHLHVGKWLAGVDVNPNGGGFKLDGAKVIGVLNDYSDPANGKYVRIGDSSGAMWVYLHLSEVHVKLGEVLKGEDMPKATFEDVKYGYAFIAGELRTDQQVRDSGWIGTDLLEFYQKLMKHVSDNTIDYGRYRKWAEAEISQLKVNVGLTQDLAERIVARAYRAATDIDPTADQAGYWVPRIKGNPSELNNLLDGLGAKDYQGDASFRSKARNYDADVKKAAESNEAGRKLQAIKDILK